MLLESIKLVNFRQFKNEYIEFAKGQDGKNVTIIIGENGTGKTTFAQAFFWCMYGETSFSDKVILNKHIAAEMKPTSPKTVMVELKLRHGEVQYTLTREQVYKKEYNNRIKAMPAQFNIAKKDRNGNTNFVKATHCESEVKSILPKELSRYFFFDGERIEKMSKDISSHKKSGDFAEAVKGLLGLNGMLSAINHLDPSKRSSSVIGIYNNSFDSRSNDKIQQYTDDINRCRAELNQIEEKLEVIDNNIKLAEDRKQEKSAQLKQYAESEKKQKRRETLNKKIDEAEKRKSLTNKSIMEEFNDKASSFFSLSLIKRAMDIIANSDFEGKDIPHINDSTIEYLINRKTCICGTHLDQGSIPYQRLIDLLQYIPPKSVSTYVAEFKKEARERLHRQQTLVEKVNDYIGSISALEDDIIEKRDELSAIDKLLSGKDVSSIVKKLNDAIRECEYTISRDKADQKKLYQKQGRLQNELQRADSEREKLINLDEKNRKIALYKEYAEQVYRELLNDYKESEEEIRNKLQDTINDIFKSIYQGGLSLSIDEKYHISVFVEDYSGDVETSTAQSISVIFAFITGIIKMARDNRNSNDQNAKLLSSEPYPLVMDAPLSAFDKRRIQSVCESLPNTAEQVIIFIKDTDGELAERFMGEKIGGRYSFEKISEFETKLV